MFRIILTIFFVILLIDTARSSSKGTEFLPKAFEAEFTQIIKYKFGSKIKEKKSDITFKYLYKGNFLMESETSGQKQVYVCNPKEFWLYSPAIIPGEKGIAQKGSTDRHCYSKLFDSLRLGLKDNKKYTVKKKTDTEFILAFAPAEVARLNVKELTINFKDKNTKFDNITSFLIHWVDQKEPLKLEKKSLTYKDSFPKETFDFQVPKNTDVQTLE